MQRWNGLGQVPVDLGRTVVTIGNFDGVHRGHQRVLSRLVELAADRSARAVAVTFEPHPIAVLYPERAPVLLDGHATRLDRLAQSGLDAVLVMTFTHELATWSPRRFVEDVLVGALHACAVVVGRDTRFGHRNSGDLTTLRELGAELGFEVLTVQDLGGEHRERWSSTWVRELVAAGEVRRAAEVLGHLHRMTGPVVHGDHRGRLLGFPTANLAPAGPGGSEGMVPADGVYAGWLQVLPDGERWPAAISVGTNPTFGEHGRRVEAYVLDRDDLDLYGAQVAVDFVERLRSTERFEDAEALVAAMHKDVEQARQVLA